MPMLWRLALEARGNGPGTVAARLANVSSFFRYLTRPVDARGGRCSRATRLPPSNARTSPPTRTRERRLRPMLWQSSTCWNARPTSGRFGTAVLLCYVLTGRRRAEIAGLRGENLERDAEGRTFYRYRGKGGKDGFRELPAPAAVAVAAYLEACGRVDLPADAPVFVSLAGRHRGQAIDPDGILRIFKGRAREAGVPADRVRTHGLRHLAAELRRRAGESVEEIQAFLDHSDLNTTGRYLARVEGTRDRTSGRPAG